MDISRVFTLLCAILLVLTLVLSITSLLVLKGTVEESEKWQLHAQALLGDIEVFAESNTSERDTHTEASKPSQSEPPSTDADVLYNKFYIRETNDKIGIYCDDGQLIRTLDVNVKTLSEKDQTRLKQGIRVNSWSELVSLIQDYE